MMIPLIGLHLSHTLPCSAARWDLPSHPAQRTRGPARPKEVAHVGGSGRAFEDCPPGRGCMTQRCPGAQKPSPGSWVVRAGC